jgi:hypothetical protein
MSEEAGGISEQLAAGTATHDTTASGISAITTDVGPASDDIAISTSSLALLGLAAPNWASDATALPDTVADNISADQPSDTIVQISDVTATDGASPSDSLQDGIFVNGGTSFVNVDDPTVERNSSDACSTLSDATLDAQPDGSSTPYALIIEQTPWSPAAPTQPAPDDEPELSIFTEDPVPPPAVAVALPLSPTGDAGPAASVSATPTGFVIDVDVGALGNVDVPLALVNAVDPVSDTADEVVNGDSARSTYDVNGTGIKVGIISDSFNALGGAGADEADGALPPAADVHILKDAKGSGETDEGRAMAQIVHSIAPGAQIYFYTDGNSDADMATAISALQSAGCQIILDDVVYLDEPFYEENGVISAAVNSVVADGSTYLTAANNSSDSFYEGTFTPISGETTGGTMVLVNNFGTAADPTIYEPITLPEGLETYIDLQWNQPFLTADGAASGPGSANSLAFELLNSSFQVVAAGNADDVGGNPLQLTEYASTSKTGTNFYLVVYENESAGPAPGEFKIVIDNDSSEPPTLQNGGVGSGTVIGHEEDPSAITVGAAPENDPTAMENYSAFGPGEFLFNGSGVALTSPVSAGKINVVAPDGNSTSVSGLDPFYGTSAATPAAAAVAALMLQANSALDPNDVQNILEDTGTPIAGSPDQTGSGMVDADEAVGASETLTFDESASVATLLGTHLGATFVGGAGSHTLIGEGGVNVLDYEAAPAAVTVNFVTDTASNGFGGTDSFSDIQEAEGSAYNDTFIVGGTGETLFGGGGTDSLNFASLAVGGVLDLIGGVFAANPATSGVNAGTIDVEDACTLQINGSSLGNTGLLEAQAGGDLDIACSLFGSGSSSVGSSAILELGASDSETVNFSGSPATLKLDAPSSFSGTISGLALGDLIDLVDTAVTTAKVVGSTLSITLSGGSTLAYQVAGALAGNFFAISSDKSGGTDLTLAPATLAQATINTASPIALGNARIGGTLSEALSIANSAAPPAEALDASVASTSGSATDGGMINLLAAGQTDTTDIVVGVGTATAGLSSGSVTLAFASDGSSTDGNGKTALPSQTVQVSGTVYREAQASVAPVNVIVHVGLAGSQALSITNSAATDGYSEDLIATVASSTGVSASGSTGDIVAGGTSSAIAVSFSTAQAGTVSGSVTVGLSSDGTSIDGFGPTSIGQQVVAVNATVDNYAVATLEELSGGGTWSQNGTSYTLSLGNLAEGASPVTVALGVLNNVTGPADLLSGSFATSGGSAFTPSGFAPFSGLAAGQADLSPSVTLSTGTAGSFTETITLDPTGSNAGGYSAALSPETLTITGTVVVSPPVLTTLVGQPVDGSTIEVQGTGAVGDSITLYADGNTTPVGSGMVGATGAFDITTTATFVDGNHTLTATETDSAGVSSAMSAGLVVGVDPQAPSLNSVLGQPANGSTFEVQGTGEAGDTIALYVGGGTVLIGSGVVGAGGTFTVTTGTDVPAGPQALTANETDSSTLTSAFSAPLDVLVANVWVGPPSGVQGKILGGAWATAADWNGGVPGAGDLAILDPSKAAYTVTSAASVTIDSLVIEPASGAEKTLPHLNITGGTFAITGASSNAGTVDVEGGKTPPTLDIFGLFTNAAAGLLSAAASGATIDLADGSLAGGTVTIVAGATAEATGGVSSPSSITGALVNDQGLLKASNGTTLTLGPAVSVSASGGVVEATGASSVLLLDGASISSGTLTSNTGGAISTEAGTTSTLAGATVSSGSTVAVTDGSDLEIQGTMAGIGTIAVDAVGDATELLVASSGATLSTAASVLLTNSAGNLILAAAAGAILTNSAATISGAGKIGAGDAALTLINNKIVDATGSAGLAVDTGNTVTNSGTLEASGAGTLTLDDSVSNSATITALGTATVSLMGVTITNTASGIVSAGAAGASLDLDAGTIAGGTVRSVAGATILAEGTALITGATVTGGGTLEASSGTLTLSGGTVNASGGTLIAALGGAIALSGTFLENCTLESTGGAIATVTGTDSILEHAIVAASTSVTVTDGSILTLEGTITNNGAIALDAAGDATELLVAASGATLNTAGSVVLSNTDENLIIAAAAGATLTNSAATISGAGEIGAGDGALTLINKKIVDATGSDPLVIDTGNAVTNSGTLEATGVGTLALDDNVGNSATITALGTATVSLDGATITNSTSGTVSAGAAGASVDLDAGTIAGGTVKIVAGATILAEGTALITGATVTGGGTLEASSGTLTLAGGTVNTSGGTVIAASGGAIDLSGTFLENGTLESTGGTIAAEAGTTTTFDNLTIAAGTSIAVTDGSTLTLDGTITNDGSIALESTGDSTELLLGSSLTLAGGGTVTLANVAGNADEILGGGSVKTLTDSNDVIAGAAAIGDGDATLQLSLKAGSTIDANTTAALVLDTGNSEIDAGLIEATGSGGLTIDDAVTNTGTLAADGGTLSVARAITGTGKAEVFSGSLLDFAGSDTNAVTFENNAANTGILALGDAPAFSGTVAGFFNKSGNSDTLDLQDIKFASAAWSFTQSSSSQGMLTVADGNGDTASIALLGQYVAAGQTVTSASSTIFQTASDDLTHTIGTLLTTSVHR